MKKRNMFRDYDKIIYGKLAKVLDILAYLKTETERIPKGNIYYPLLQNAFSSWILSGI